MKKIIILLCVFVFVTLLVSSCVATLRGDGTYRGYNDNYRNGVSYQNYDNDDHYRRNGKLFKNRHQRMNHSYIKVTDGPNSLIIR